MARLIQDTIRMLVWQAAVAQEIWNDVTYTPAQVREIVEALGVDQPLVSQHLRVLRDADLLTSERHGKEVVYSLADEHIAHIVGDAITHAAGYRETYRIVRHDGSTAWIEDYADVELDASRQLCRVYGISQDVTERDDEALDRGKKVEKEHLAEVLFAQRQTLDALEPRDLRLEDGV